MKQSDGGIGLWDYDPIFSPNVTARNETDALSVLTVRVDGFVTLAPEVRIIYVDEYNNLAVSVRTQLLDETTVPNLPSLSTGMTPRIFGHFGI